MQWLGPDLIYVNPTQDVSTSTLVSLQRWPRSRVKIRTQYLTDAHWLFVWSLYITMAMNESLGSFAVITVHCRTTVHMWPPYELLYQPIIWHASPCHNLLKRQVTPSGISHQPITCHHPLVTLPTNQKADTLCRYVCNQSMIKNHIISKNITES